MTAADAAFPRCGWDLVDPYDPDERDLWVKLEHLGRYLFAVDIATASKAGVVVDAGCGPGYGLLELARAAKRVIGVDSDPKMVAMSHARLSDGPWRPDNVRVVRASLDDDRMSLELGEERAGLVVCFETLEHVLDLESAVGSVASLLGPGGTFIISVPARGRDKPNVFGLPANRHHKHTFTFAGLRALLARHGLTVAYRCGQSLPNQLQRRESELRKHGLLEVTTARLDCLHDHATVRVLARLLAYPSVEDTDGSYSLIAVGRRDA